MGSELWDEVLSSWQRPATGERKSALALRDLHGSRYVASRATRMTHAAPNAYDRTSVWSARLAGRDGRLLRTRTDVLSERQRDYLG